MKILRFTAKWCQPCKGLDMLLNSMEYKATIEKIDIDEDEKTPIEYGVRNVPTLIKIDENGNVVDRLVGLPPKTKLAEFLND